VAEAPKPSTTTNVPGLDLRQSAGHVELIYERRGVPLVGERLDDQATQRAVVFDQQDPHPG
jgi:hypothetical protein